MPPNTNPTWLDDLDTSRGISICHFHWKDLAKALFLFTGVWHFGLCWHYWLDVQTVCVIVLDTWIHRKGRGAEIPRGGPLLVKRCSGAAQLTTKFRWRPSHPGQKCCHILLLVHACERNKETNSSLEHSCQGNLIRPLRENFSLDLDLIHVASHLIQRLAHMQKRKRYVSESKSFKRLYLIKFLFLTSGCYCAHEFLHEGILDRASTVVDMRLPALGLESSWA